MTGFVRASRLYDVGDLQPDNNALRIEHRIDQGTKLKNGEDWVYLGPKWFQPTGDYLDNPDRHDVTDDYGRRPLITSQNGGPTGDTIYNWVNETTYPCRYGGCPHNREPTPSGCEALGGGQSSKCPSGVGPYAIRRGSITHQLNKNVPPETVSERCDVSLEVLYQHYDVRIQQEKMDVRRQQLEGTEL